MNSIYNTQNGLPFFKKADVWVESKFSKSWNDAFLSNGDINAPVVYKTPVFHNIDTSLQAPFTVNISEKVVINTAVFNLIMILVDEELLLTCTRKTIPAHIYFYQVHGLV